MILLLSSFVSYPEIPTPNMQEVAHTQTIKLAIILYVSLGDKSGKEWNLIIWHVNEDDFCASFNQRAGKSKRNNGPARST